MALYVVFKERQQHLTFLGQKNEVQMIFEVSEKSITESLIIYSMKNYMYVSITTLSTEK